MFKLEFDPSNKPLAAAIGAALAAYGRGETAVISQAATSTTAVTAEETAALVAASEEHTEIADALARENEATETAITAQIEDTAGTRLDLSLIHI